ncbi:LytTr DNA-binding domain protein [Ostertagia ostertagi]
MASAPHLVFLDIEMPGGNGFDLLRMFTKIDFEVVFITAYNQYAVRAFREHALDYLLKPVDIDALQEAVARAEQQSGLKETGHKLEQYLQQPQGTGKISIPVQDGYLFINSYEIVRCEGAGSYSLFYLANGKKQIVSMRLKECEELLPATQFFRVHNSHIVNLKYVARYVRGRGGNIQMLDGSMVDVSVSRKDAFLEMMRRHS